MAQSTVECSTGVVVELGEEAPIRVLHVDDASGFLKVAKQCLEMEGNFQVDTASSVEEALEKMKKKTYDMIVSDYLMPGKDGLEFLKELRDSGNTVPFIMFTGKGREEVAIKALNLGADRYLNKSGAPETVYGELAYSIRRAAERNKSEERIRESEEKFRKIFEEALDAILIADTETGTVIDCNRAACELVDRDKSELVGKHQRILHPSEECEGRFSRTFKRHLKEKEGQFVETQVITKNGEIKNVAIKANVFELNGKKLIQGIFRDITERKKAEEKLEAMNEKLRVIGRLARHDVRNKLSAVTGNVYLVKKLTDDPKVQERLSDIESACRQAVRIFDFARTYERLGAEELAYMDVEENLEVAVSLFSDLHDVKVVNDCRGLTVLADSLLTQLFYNLVDNSLKHGEKVSQIRVHYEDIGKDQLKLVYEDDGVGILKVEKETIFKEGYGKGTGYGLYLIKKICEAYGWTIRETGKPGKGTQFTITVPKLHAKF